jgi:hypothetical protein
VRVVAVENAWDENLPIFANETFLKAVGKEHGWIAGVDDSGRHLCFLPYTVTSEMGIRMARFRVETIRLVEDLCVGDEREFLAECVAYLRGAGVDVIIPGTTNAIFRTFPVGAAAAPYGSYVVDLNQGEDDLWRRVDRITRQNINTARKSGVVVREATGDLDRVYGLIRETFKRSSLPFMSRDSLSRYVQGLGHHGKVLVAEYANEMQSCVIYAFSKYCAYAVYGGNSADQFHGSNKLLHWEAIRLFRGLGCSRYDFVGARIDPAKGSKAEAINSFKRRLGGSLTQGYMWKYSLRTGRSLVYSVGVKLLRGGDIVDRERSKIGAASGIAEQVGCQDQSGR